MVVARHLPAVRAKRQQAAPPPNSGTQPIRTIGPVQTITQVTTFFPPAATSVITPSTTPLPTSTTSSTPPPATPPSTSIPVSPPPNTSRPATSPSIIAKPTTSGSSGQDNDASRSSNPNGLSGGAIAGIVLGIILLLLILAFFLLRRRHFQRRQKNRNNATWLAKGGIEGGAGGVTGGYAFANGMDEEKFTAQASNLPPLQPVRGPYHPYATSDFNEFSDVAISPRTVVPPIPPAPIATPSQAAMTPIKNASGSMVSVRCTFVPSLPDELHIAPGDSLRVLEEFDDGWSLCIKTSTGEEGMVPSECFNRSSSSPKLSTPGAGNLEFGGGIGPDRRASSLVGSGIHGRI